MVKLESMLTPRELEMACLVAEGLTDKEIAIRTMATARRTREDPPLAPIARYVREQLATSIDG